MQNYYYLGMLLFTLLSAYYSYKVFRPIFMVHNAEGWPSIEASVRDARILELPWASAHGRTSIQHICMDFSVDGLDYTCVTPSFYEVDKKVVSRLISRLKPGDKINVHYNPEKPYQNVFLAPKKHVFAFSILRLLLLLFVTVVIYAYSIANLVIGGAAL